MPSLLLSLLLALASLVPATAGEIASRAIKAPVTEADLHEVAAWVEAASGRRAPRPFPTVVWTQGHALDRLSRFPGTVHGAYGPETNVLRLRIGASRALILGWSAHEFAHWDYIPENCHRDGELFAHEMAGRWARAHGLHRLAPHPRTIAQARTLPCLAETLDALRAAVETRPAD
jgi:hypothetical protein